MNWIKFLKSKLFFLSLGVALLLILFLLKMTFSSLDDYTHHGEKIHIPNLYGYSLKEAIKELEKKQLRYSIYDSMYNKSFPAGAILTQQPPAGAIVKRNRKIFLAINSHQPEQVIFPNIKDNSLRQACEILKINGFKIGRLNYTSNQFYNIVLGATIGTDTIQTNRKINKGATINLILGNGYGKTVAIPNFIGKTLQQSRDILQYTGFNCGKVLFDESVKDRKDSLESRVIFQIPNYNAQKQIHPGSNIHFQLTVDKTKIQIADSLLQRVLNNLPIDSTLLKIDSTFLKLNNDDRE